MSFFKYCYYRMYKAYEEKNDSPFLRSLIYISILQSIILTVLFIFIKGILVRTNVTADFNVKAVYVWLPYALILLASWLWYSRFQMNQLDKSFESWQKANLYIKTWMLIAAPFVILFGGIILYVFAFGGVILGRQVTGFF